jgi:predicted secreted protein
MTKRSLLAAVAALCILVPAAAGDIATFVDLGFSPDSAYFMFGQYGLESATGKPFAELYLVDTKKNDFLPKGTARKTFDARLEPGQDGSGALWALFAENVAGSRSYKIDHLAPGRLVYLLLDGEEAPATLSFRDFKTGSAWEVTMQKSVAPTKTGVSSSFGIAMTLTPKEGQARKLVVGNPGLKRPDVSDYVIRRIIVAPDEKTLVFIIEKRMSAKGDQAIRYMVETVKLP